MQPPTLTLLDPTSLLGREVADLVAESFPHVRRQLFHTTGSGEHLIAEIGGEAALVPPLGDPEELSGSRAVVATATPGGPAAARLLGWLRTNPRVALVDLTQPGLAPAESRGGESGAGLRWFHAAHPALAATLHMLTALAPLRPHSCHATVLCPVSDLGVDAIDELAGQGAARLSGGTPKRPRLLSSVLAFDLLPSPPVRSEEFAAQIRARFPDLEVHLAVADAGVFHGHLAAVQIGCREAVKDETVRHLLRNHSGIRLARRGERVRPSDVAGSDHVVCAQLDVGTQWVTAWLAADGLRCGPLRTAADVISRLTVE